MHNIQIDTYLSEYLLDEPGQSGRVHWWSGIVISNPTGQPNHFGPLGRSSCPPYLIRSVPIQPAQAGGILPPLGRFNRVCCGCGAGCVGSVCECHTYLCTCNNKISPGCGEQLFFLPIKVWFTPSTPVCTSPPSFSPFFPFYCDPSSFCSSDLFYHFFHIVILPPPLKPAYNSITPLSFHRWTVDQPMTLGQA